MFERFLERLSFSEYKEKLIIKGGLILSSIIGINLRNTMDIDADIVGINFTQEEIEKLIININLNDNTQMKLEKIEEIKEESEYGGYRVKLVGNLENFIGKVERGEVINFQMLPYKNITHRLANEIVQISNLYCPENQRQISKNSEKGSISYIDVKDKELEEILSQNRNVKHEFLDKYNLENIPYQDYCELRNQIQILFL